MTIFLSQRLRMQTAMFLIGSFATLSQVLLLREMLTAFWGSELVIGIVLASWLAGIGLGAFSGRLVVVLASTNAGKRAWLTALLIVMTVCIPFQVYAIRVVRSILNVPVGEYTSYGAALLASVFVFIPGCWAIGCSFPLVCGMLAEDTQARREKSPAGIVYIWEAIGSTMAGLAASFVLLPFLSPYRIVLIAISVSMAGVVVVAVRWFVMTMFAVLAAVTVSLALFFPTQLVGIENKFVESRWRAFGVISDNSDWNADRVKIHDSRDTIYQNLAVIAVEDQFVLYANGQVVFVFPDKVGYEDSVHFIMAQNPFASSVLLIGGNPVGDVPELLKYPISRLTYVDLDPGIREIVRRTVPHLYGNVAADPRIEWLSDDAPHFVKRCKRKFDIVLIRAPAPSTALANRFYTKEFYEDVSRLLTIRGFMYTELHSSERLQSEALDLAASVYVTLKEVFGVVLVTAESQNRFFASRDATSGLTFNRKILRDRSLAANPDTVFFNPEYFLYRDEISADKVKHLEERLANVGASANTMAAPIAHYYNLLLTARVTGSKALNILSVLKRVGYQYVLWLCGVMGMACLFMGVLLGRFVRDVAVGRFWSRMMTGILMATTGFCGMALEVLFIFVFQGMYGYVYTKMGAIFAVFMLGLIAGAWLGRIIVGKNRSVRLTAILFAQAVMCALVITAPRIMKLESFMPDIALTFIEPVIYTIIALLGCGVGMVFPLANRIYTDSGGSVNAAAAITDASDHIGAAIGGLLTGVVVVPVYGVSGASIIIGSVLLVGVLCAISAFAACN
ncbi:MAG: hypothetical protein JXN60_03545 [Lentisphaerae bacterium]|nr:hypothetical protein [Lentisphaerota bacterium]